jgi:hypothetical protein
MHDNSRAVAMARDRGNDFLGVAPQSQRLAGGAS